MIRRGQLRKWVNDGSIFMVINPVDDERIERYGIKHWLIFSNGFTTYRRESSINEGSIVISESD